MNHFDHEAREEIEKQHRMDKMKEKLWNILTLIAVAAVGFVVKGATMDLKELRLDVNNMNGRVVAIENNRFTTANGLEMQRQLSDIRESLARVETELRMNRKP